MASVHEIWFLGLKKIRSIALLMTRNQYPEWRSFDPYPCGCSLVSPGALTNIEAKFSYVHQQKNLLVMSCCFLFLHA